MVILRDAAFVDVEGLVRYIYRGEVDVGQDRLQGFLRTAEVLKIKGLADQGMTSSDLGLKEDPILAHGHRPPTPSQPHISHSKVPPIKVPVPPTSSALLKRNSFTNLAHYLSGSPGLSPEGGMTSPPAQKRRKTAPRRHDVTPTSTGGGYLKQPTPPPQLHYSGSTSSVTASPASPPHSHSTEGGDAGSLEICEDMDR